MLQGKLEKTSLLHDSLAFAEYGERQLSAMFCTHCFIALNLSWSRSEDLPPRNRASMLQGVLHPGQQAEADLWGCQAGLQVGRRRAAQHRNGGRAALDRALHSSAPGWGRRLLDRPPSQPTAAQAGDHEPRLPLTVLLARWKQSQVQVFVIISIFSATLCVMIAMA